MKLLGKRNLLLTGQIIPQKGIFFGTKCLFYANLLQPSSFQKYSKESPKHLYGDQLGKVAQGVMEEKGHMTNYCNDLTQTLLLTDLYDTTNVPKGSAFTVNLQHTFHHFGIIIVQERFLQTTVLDCSLEFHVEFQYHLSAGCACTFACTHTHCPCWLVEQRDEKIEKWFSFHFYLVCQKHIFLIFYGLLLLLSKELCGKPQSWHDSKSRHNCVVKQ